MKHIYVKGKKNLPEEIDDIIHEIVYRFFVLCPQAKELKIAISHLDKVLSVNAEEIHTHFFLEMRVTYLTPIETQSLNVVVED